MATGIQYLTKYYKNQNDMNSSDVVGLFVNKDATKEDLSKGSTDTTGNDSDGYNFAPSSFGVHLFQPKDNIIRVTWHHKNIDSTFKLRYWDGPNMTEVDNDAIYSSLYKRPNYNSDDESRGGFIYEFRTYCYDIPVAVPGTTEKYYFYQIQENDTDNKFGSYFRIASSKEYVTVGIIGDSGVALNGVEGWTAGVGNGENGYVRYVNQAFYSSCMTSIPEGSNFAPPADWEAYYKLRENTINGDSPKDSYITYKMPMTNCYLNQMMHVGDMTYGVSLYYNTNSNPLPNIYDNSDYNNIGGIGVFYFLRQFEQLFSTVPFVATPGNHEIEDDCSGRSTYTLSNFFHFFPQSVSLTDHYYCTEVGGKDGGTVVFEINTDKSITIFDKLDTLSIATTDYMDSTPSDKIFEYTLAANIITNLTINNFQIISGLHAGDYDGDYPCIPEAGALSRFDSVPRSSSEKVLEEDALRGYDVEYDTEPKISDLDSLLSIQNPSICITHIDSPANGFTLYDTYNADSTDQFRLSIVGHAHLQYGGIGADPGNTKIVEAADKAGFILIGSSGVTTSDTPYTGGMAFYTHIPNQDKEYFYTMQVNYAEKESGYADEPGGTGIWYTTFAETPQNIGEYNTISFNKYSATNIDTSPNPKPINTKEYYFYTDSNPALKPKPTKNKTLKKIWGYNNTYNTKKLICIKYED